MGKMVMAYHVRHKKALLKKFEKNIVRIAPLLNNHFNENESHILQEVALTEYDKIIPIIPYYKGFRENMFNDMLLISSQILAAYRVLKPRGQHPDDIWEICFMAIVKQLDTVPTWKKKLARQLWHKGLGTMMKRRGQKNRKETLCGFEMEYICGDGHTFDYGINYTQCGHKSFLDQHGAGDMLPYVCLADLALSDAFGWGLTRTQTLGDGCTHCDFRFKYNGATTMTSTQPHIQAMIDKNMRVQ